MENTLDLIKTENLDIREIVKRPDQFPEELVAASLDLIKDLSGQLKEAKMRIEADLVSRMTEDKAKKMEFIGIDGLKRIATLNNGKMECKSNAPDVLMKENGFDPHEIGKYETTFKVSWADAKRAREYGGLKKEIIDQIFKPGKKSISIKVVKNAEAVA